MAKKLLDASALLAYLFQESGGEKVELSNSLISTVNLSEVLQKIMDKGVSGKNKIRDFKLLGLTTVSFDEVVAEGAANLYSVGKPLGLSLADRACLATALQLGVEVQTADKVWRQLSLAVPIEVIR